MTWAREQPQRGDLVLHCGHLCPEYECGQICSRGFHWWDGREFADEDGYVTFTRGRDEQPKKARWVVVCQLCLMRNGPPTDATKFPGERRWNADRRRVIARLETRGQHG